MPGVCSDSGDLKHRGPQTQQLDEHQARGNSTRALCMCDILILFLLMINIMIHVTQSLRLVREKLTKVALDKVVSY